MQSYRIFLRMKDEPITKHSRYNHLFTFSVQTIIIPKGTFLDLTMVTLLVKVKISKGIWENTSQLLLEESAIQLIYETE